MKIELNFSAPKLPSGARSAATISIVLLLLVAAFGVWSDFPWNGNPFVWISAKELYMDGTTQRDHFDLAGACTSFRKAVDMYPKDPQFQYSLGEACERLSKLPEAEEHYRRAAALRPNFTNAWLRLSTVQFLSSKVSDALNSAREAVRSQPNSAEANCQLALLQAATGKRQEGDQLFARTAAMDQSARYHFLSGQYLRMEGKKEEAEHQFLRAATMDMREPEYAEWLGMCLLEDGKDAEAREWLNKAVRNDSRCAQYWENYAAILMRTGETDAAVVALDKAHTLAPENELYTKRLAKCQMNGKHYQMAEQTLEQLILFQKNNDDEVWDLLIDSIKQGRRFGEAEALLRELSQKVDKSLKARALQNLGDIYALQGKGPESIDAYKEALSSNPSPAMRKDIESSLANITQGQ